MNKPGKNQEDPMNKKSQKLTPPSDLVIVTPYAPDEHYELRDPHNPYYYYEVDTDGGPLEIVAQSEEDVEIVVDEMLYPPVLSLKVIRLATPEEVEFAHANYLPKGL
jgi:hypothetical protein